MTTSGERPSPVYGAGEPCPCEEAIAHVWDLLDGELEPRDCERVNAHLSRCSRCAELYRDDSALKAAISRACACEEAPAELRRWVERRVATWRIDAAADGSSITASYTELRRRHLEP